MSNSTSPIEHGYLVLADISGYTSYLAGVELDHAHEILTDLLETIIDRFKPSTGEDRIYTFSMGEAASAVRELMRL